ncbi:NAD-dependent epimerase/dehydratase family protein [Prosthecomicrobium pneumaticum]|uniref:Nucleoside-diphosphate-sugar epimerase n=1 Tax=Prosthecomicrobium pneumaticum TaxID=81895 RepID=A0A7W9L3C2_9HYPH|nr:NAD-dependent epimerase/dehydratase family protein [Prosthecomicrobium pneumaticum]MBB5754385.1 nucleoside-diphosphate-sugar epimerase [Prosthecomicrobium pneumaticum]
MSDEKIALVLGATGGIGGTLARRLAADGWRIRALHRDAAARPATPGVDWIQGDAMRRDDVMAAARGTTLIVHAVNPPGYRDWDKLVLPMLDNTIAAAKASGARILFPGTVYNFGPDAFRNPSETAPQNPLTRKGAIRVEMERRLERAAAEGVRTLIVRAGDFFGPGAGNSWFAQLVRPGRPVRTITDPGRPGLAHQWAYLPDMAETFVRLLGVADRLPDFAVFHMRGHVDPDGTAMIAAIRRAVDRPEIKLRRFPWWLLPLAAPFVTVLREVREMRYLWREPVVMTNERLVALLGVEPHTALDTAIRETLAGLGCLPQAAGVAGDGVSPARQTA